MRSLKGQSLVMWAVIFAVVSASVIIFLSPVKRIITAKTMRTTDHLLWGMWGDPVSQDGGKNLNQIGEAVTTTKQDQTGVISEKAGIITTTSNSTTDTVSTSSNY